METKAIVLDGKDVRNGTATPTKSTNAAKSGNTKKPAAKKSSAAEKDPKVIIAELDKARKEAEAKAQAAEARAIAAEAIAKEGKRFTAEERLKRLETLDLLRNAYMRGFEKNEELNRFLMADDNMGKTLKISNGRGDQTFAISDSATIDEVVNLLRNKMQNYLGEKAKEIEAFEL